MDRVDHKHQSRDRRRHPRRGRLLRLTLEDEGKAIACVTTDVSLSGAFLNCKDPPAVGRRVTLTLHDTGPGGVPLVLRGQVVRVVHADLRASRLPGLAVAFAEIAMRVTVEELRGILASLLPASGFDHGTFTVDERGWAVYRQRLPSSEAEARARHVHKERLDLGKMVPSDLRGGESIRRSLATSVERRRKPRSAIYVECTYYQHDMPYVASALNISELGIYVKTDHALPSIGSRVVLHFPVGAAPDPQYVKISGRVVRWWDPATEPLPGLAMTVDKVDELGRRGVFRRYMLQLERKAKPPRKG